jgi:hypothetical protein
MLSSVEVPSRLLRGGDAHVGGGRQACSDSSAAFIYDSSSSAARPHAIAFVELNVLIFIVLSFGV